MKWRGESYQKSYVSWKDRGEKYDMGLKNVITYLYVTIVGKAYTVEMWGKSNEGQIAGIKRSEVF